MNAELPVSVQLMVAVLLVLSGVIVLISAAGVLFIKDFFRRMHPPALAYTLGSWCVTLASMVYFSLLESRPMLHPWLITILLSFSVPVTTVLLARAALFRRRAAGIAGTPPPLSARASSAGAIETPGPSRR
jgi:multicomponent K+:H+ antiporter subunit G